MSRDKDKTWSGRERAFKFGTRGTEGRDTAANAWLMSSMGFMLPNKTLDRFFNKRSADRPTDQQN